MTERDEKYSLAPQEAAGPQRYEKTEQFIRSSRREKIIRAGEAKNEKLSMEGTLGRKRSGAGRATSLNPLCEL